MSILSSYYNQKISKRTFYHGEVCLSGKINAKYDITEKLSLPKYGIERAVIPSNIDYKNFDVVSTIKIESVYQVISLFDALK